MPGADEIWLVSAPVPKETCEQKPIEFATGAMNSVGYTSFSLQNKRLVVKFFFLKGRSTVGRHIR